MENRIKVLKEKVKKYLSEKIFKVPKKIREREKQIEVYLAFKHDPEFINEIKKKIKERFGQEKEIKIKIKRDLLAGIRIKTKNILIKGSLKDFLESIKNVNL
jgi:F0F1-type ATP synthase delta subunit